MMLKAYFINKYVDTRLYKEENKKMINIEFRIVIISGGGRSLNGLCWNYILRCCLLSRF